MSGWRLFGFWIQSFRIDRSTWRGQRCGRTQGGMKSLRSITRANDVLALRSELVKPPELSTSQTSAIPTRCGIINKSNQNVKSVGARVSNPTGIIEIVPCDASNWQVSEPVPPVPPATIMTFSSSIPLFIALFGLFRFLIRRQSTRCGNRSC